MEPWIISDDMPLANVVRRALETSSLVCGSERVLPLHTIDLEGSCFASRGGLVFVTLSEFTPERAQFVHQLRAASPTTATIVVVAPVRGHTMVLEAIRAGAHDFVAADESLQAEIRGLVARFRSDAERHHDRGRVVTVLPCHSSRDSAVLAVNLAAAVAKANASCGLLDLHPSGSDFDLLLKLTARHTLADLLLRDDAIDDAIFAQALTPHESGVRLIAAPAQVLASEHYGSPNLQRMIELARSSWPCAVVHAVSPQFAAQTQLLQTSDAVLLAIRLDVISLHRAKQQLEALTVHNKGLRNVHVVAVDTGQSGELPLSAALKVLQIPAITPLSHDAVASICSINLGNPYVLEYPRSKLARETASLAAKLLSSVAADAPATPSASQPVGTGWNRLIQKVTSWPASLAVPADWGAGRINSGT